MSQENIENSYIFGRGFTDPNAVFSWNPDAKETVNPHIIISGLSGAGKSTLLRDIVRYLQYIEVMESYYHNYFGNNILEKKGIKETFFSEC